MGVWMMFVKNIDANQSFLLLFTPVVGLSIGLLLLHLWSQKKITIALILSILYIIPEFIFAFRVKTPIPITDHQTSNILKKMGAASILYIPDLGELKNIYQFNERVYTGIDHFILDNPTLELYSAAAAIMTDTLQFNPVTLNMYHTFRSISPVYQNCGLVQSGSDCLLEFAKKHRINYLCVKKGTPGIKNMNQYFESSQYIFYKLF